MDSQREGNGCQQCSVTSSTSRNQGLQTSKNGEFSDTTLPQQDNMLRRDRMTRSQQWQVQICPTTGGKLDLSIPTNTSVEELKTVIARKLKLPINKINLLYKERIMKSGPLIQHGVVDGCKFTLLPNVETGLSTPKADHHSIMQVLENLSDRQVNEFLAGKAPLTLAMRLGEHMMFVQLQLSSSPFAASKQNNSSSNCSSPTSANNSTSQFPHHQLRRQTMSSSMGSRRHQHYPHRHVHPIHQQQAIHHHQPQSHHYHPYQHGPQTVIHPANHQHRYHGSNHRQVMKQGEEMRMSTHTAAEENQVNHHMVNTIKEQPTSMSSVSCSETSPASSTSSSSSSVCMPNAQHEHLKDILKSTHPGEQQNEYPVSPTQGFRSPPSPTRILSSPFDSPVSLSSGYTSSSSPMSDCSVPSSPEATTPDASFSASASRINYDQQYHCSSRQQHKGKPVRLFPQPEMEEDKLPGVRRLSTTNESTEVSEVQQNCPEVKTQRESTTESSQPENKGAVIDSMYHMGRGIYSGTFSGTLNPTLQDGHGRPKRSLGTIVHILKDLLGAAPKGKIQVDSLSSGGVATHTQHVWSPGKASSGQSGQRPQRMHGIRPLCSHHAAGCQERTQPLRRPRHSQEDSTRLAKENQVMKDKVEQVQMMLQQRRQRRKARREARASPYTWQPSETVTEGSHTDLLLNKSAVDEVKVDDSSCENAEKDVRGETSEHDGTFPSELKPEAVLV